MTKCYQVLSSVMKSYQVLSSVIKGYQVLSSVIKWYQVVSSFIKCNQVLSDDASVIKCYHVLSTVITCYHVVSSVIKWPFYGHSNLGPDWTLVVHRHRSYLCYIKSRILNATQKQTPQLSTNFLRRTRNFLCPALHFLLFIDKLT